MTKPLVALFCGSRNWDDEQRIQSDIANLPHNATVIHGAAPGADTIAGRLAAARGLSVRSYPADWARWGQKRAGPIRNQQMIDEGHPDIVYAFPLPDSRGTWDMVRRAKLAGVRVVIR